MRKINIKSQEKLGNILVINWMNLKKYWNENNKQPYYYRNLKKERTEVARLTCFQNYNRTKRI